MVNLDMRDFYLKDLNLIGCTAWDEPIFPNLVSYIQSGEIRPLVAKTFALEDIAPAQQECLKKEHIGNFVLLPPSPPQGCPDRPGRWRCDGGYDMCYTLWAHIPDEDDGRFPRFFGP